MMSLRAILPLLCLTAVGCGGSDSGPAAPTPTAPVPFSTTDLTVGDGAAAAVGQMLTVDYTGWLYDPTRPENKGQQFDTSAGRGAFRFVLGAGSVIAGWDQGLPGMRVGGIRRLVIPPSLAYGSSSAGNGAIPPNSTLLFEVELLDVN